DAAVIDRDDIWMLKRLGAFRLADEALKQGDVLRERARQNLDRDHVARLDVNRLEDRAHSPGAKRMKDLVTANPGQGPRGSGRVTLGHGVPALSRQYRSRILNAHCMPSLIARGAIRTIRSRHD